MTDINDLTTLAIDTAFKKLIVGIQFSGDRLVQSDEQVDRSHGQFIMKKIGELLQSASMTPSMIEQIVINLGPGSFTGLRIGLATAKGMAVALGIPIVGISTFDIAAHCLREDDASVHIIIPLNRDEVVVSVAKDGKTNIEEAEIMSLAQAVKRASGDPIATIGVDPLSDQLDDSVENLSYRLKWTAADLIYLGIQKRSVMDDEKIDLIEPLYFQKSYAELKFDEKKSDG